MSATIRPLIVCGPSGVGKSTLISKILEEFPNKFEFSVSHTTRKPRPGEQNHVHYHFTDKDTMTEAIKKGEFLENAIFGGNMYGTSKMAVEAIANKGKVCILDIDVQGVKQIKQTDLNPRSIFIKPPNIEALKQRLLARKTETEESLKSRLAMAEAEIEYGVQPGNFDLVIVNDNVESAYNQFKQFIVEHVLVFKRKGNL